MCIWKSRRKGLELVCTGMNGNNGPDVEIDVEMESAKDPISKICDLISQITVSFDKT